MQPKTRPVAVVGGNRIPFARSNTVYAGVSNQEMLTAAIDGLVDRFGLQGERLGEVVAGDGLDRPGSVLAEGGQREVHGGDLVGHDVPPVSPMLTDRPRQRMCSRVADRRRGANPCPR